MKNANNEKRLHEVMGRLDKTFKSKLNEGFEEIEASSEEVPAEVGAEELGIEIAPEEEPIEVASAEDKIVELTAKVDELYALLHGEAGEEAPAEEVPVEPEAGEEIGGDVENLQEWNFDKKKGEDKEEDKEEEKPAEEDKEEKKEEIDEEIEAPAKPKVPVEAIAKVKK